MTPDRFMLEDTITGQFRQAVGRIHLHPDVQIVADSEDRHSYRLTLPGGGQIVVRVANAEATIVPSVWHPRFGQSITSNCIEVAKFQAANSKMDTAIELGRPSV
jgi:uncharacterized heparinase superfamily protein